MKIAILGAESTGKSQLADALANGLRSQGKTVSLVGEYLREWCDIHGRTPRADEQAFIAHEQVRRVEEAAAAMAVVPLGTNANTAKPSAANSSTVDPKPSHLPTPRAPPIVIADTTALMTAVYSELLFNDASLHGFAAAHQRSYGLTLVTGLDLPWVADGVQRDGPHTREAADSLLRAALGHAALGYQVVYGTGAARLANALHAVNAADASNTTILVANNSIGTRDRALFTFERPEKRAIWAWPCDKCSDPDCEHRLFSQLLR